MIKNKKAMNVVVMIMSICITIGMLCMGETKTYAINCTLQNPVKSSNGNVTWDCVWFGNYYQNNIKGKTKNPIKWRVLSVKGDKALLISDCILDRKAYNESSKKVTWENSTIRSWLNGYGTKNNVDKIDYTRNNFFNMAFSNSEQKAIEKTKIINSNNSDYKTKGGNNTNDKVFLLSLDEVKNEKYGFTKKYGGNDSGEEFYTKRRTAVMSKYVQWKIEQSLEDYSVCGYWWLRTLGSNSSSASYVNNYGDLITEGTSVNDNSDPQYIGIRPAIYLNLKNTKVYSYAGTVNTKGETTSGKVTAPAKAKITKVIRGKKKISLELIGIKGVKGYIIQYGTKNNFKGAKTKYTTKKKITVKNLKSKKKYYFRAKAYKLKGQTKVLSKKWSTVKMVEVK